MPRDADSWARALLLALGLALGVWLRIDGVAEAALFGDEYHTYQAVDEGWGTVLTTFDRVGSHVVLPALQKLSLAAFGDGVLGMRLVAIVPGLLTLLLLYPIGRRLVGPTPAVLATLALAVSPIHVYYSRFARSYALLVLLGLLLADALLRQLAGDGRSRRRWVLVGACAALLPYTHLSGAGFVAGLGIAGLLLARSQGVVRPALITFGGAAVAVILLYAPLFSQVRAFSDSMPEDMVARPQTWFGIPLLLAGGSAAAIAWLVGLPLAVAGLWRWRRDVAAVTAAAIVGPLVALLAMRPHGMEYAWSRYLLNSLPFALLALAWGLEAALSAAARSRTWGGRTALVLGVLLLAAEHLSGPLAASRRETGTFANSYLAIHPLTAFDVPDAVPSPGYAIVAADLDARRIIEAPPLLTRSVLLFRNNARQHGKDVLIGWPERLPSSIDGVPYAELGRLEPGEADYLVLHKNLRREVNVYWTRVYRDLAPDRTGMGEEGLMERHKATFVRGQRQTDPAFAEALGRALRQALGEPLHEDQRLVLWKLTP